MDDSAAAREEHRSLGLPVAWVCGLCSYYLVAMDSAGRPLPLAAGPGGRVLPVQCPHCGVEHKDWVEASPFDDYYAHANLPAAFSGLVRHGNPIDPAVVDSLVAEAAPAVHIMRRANDAAVLDESDGGDGGGGEEGHHEVLVCRRCRRRMLRHDTGGRVLAIPRGPGNQPGGLDCPGCGARHSKWAVLALGAELDASLSSSASVSDVSQLIVCDSGR